MNKYQSMSIGELVARVMLGITLALVFVLANEAAPLLVKCIAFPWAVAAALLGHFAAVAWEEYSKRGLRNWLFDGIKLMFLVAISLVLMIGYTIWTNLAPEAPLASFFGGAMLSGLLAAALSIFFAWVWAKRQLRRACKNASER